MKHIFLFPFAILRHIRLTIFLLLIFWIIPGSTIDSNNQWYAIVLQIGDYSFDYLGWEAKAISDKIGQTLWGLHPYLSEPDRSQFVRDYMADLTQAQQLERQINAIYVNPDVDNPETESAKLRAERDALRADLDERQLMAEAILEGQVAAVLVDEGFGLAGQLFPPMSMHFTEVPNLLIVSPRDEIRFDVSLNLTPLTVDKKAEIEARIDNLFDVSTLIEPLGGIALYPAMIIETSSLVWSIETFAHEWVHHYLFFFPLGLSYFTGGDAFASEARIINETTADTFGKQIGRKVLERYYPELVPPVLPTPTSSDSNQPTPTPDPNAFNFGATMNETRVTVDQMLAEGKIEEAEAYMESQRQLFVAHGYNIRKLNQAYFAFYGGYQGGDIPGVGGTDPIGPNVRAVLEKSSSLHDFAVNIRGVTTRAELAELVERLS